jgi:hypothetical protein
VSDVRWQDRAFADGVGDPQKKLIAEVSGGDRCRQALIVEGQSSPEMVIGFPRAFSTL